MTLVTLKNVHKSYANRHVLEGVSLHLEDGERVGLLGQNGSGKSTLLKIVAGLEPPDEGERTVRRDLTLGYLAQEPALAPELSILAAVREGLPGRAELMVELERMHERVGDPGVDPERLEVLLARQAHLEDQLHHLGGHDVDHAARAMISRLGLEDADARCGTLSGGERRRVALARLLLSAPDLLLLDEPTNHLDAMVTDWLEDELLASRTPLVLVTHDRYFLDRIVDRILELDRGDLNEYQGGYGDYLVQHAERLAALDRSEASRRNLLRRETEWMRRGPPARTTKAKARIGRYRSLVGSAPKEASLELELSLPPGPRLGDRVLRLAGVTKALGGRTLVRGLDLEIGPGMRLGIVGRNGAGKTTLLKLCLGQLAPDQGTVSVGPTVRFASIDQVRSDLDPGKTVLQEIGREYDHVRFGDRVMRIESFLDQFLFPGAMKHTSVSRLSGGERNRVLLAKLLCTGGTVLALDEPTNDLDLTALRALEEALRAFPGVVLVVSHDRYFLDRVATHILHLDGNGHARLHHGDMSSFLEHLAREQASAAAPEPSSEPPPSKKAAGTRPAKEVRLSGKERRELLELPERIAAAEAEVAALDARLADPALYQKPNEDWQRLTREREAAQAKVGTLYRRWEELDALA